MTTPRHLCTFALAAGLLLAGCSSPTMKGTPFYTGEYAVDVPGADERRVNLWPLAYYREPALSVLWPLIEHTEEHVAVRPVFSAYGDTKSYWEYNLFWPLCQTDSRSDDHRLFPYFWGSDKPGDAARSYHVLFPFVWHFEDEAYSLFPLWLHTRDGGAADAAADRDTWLLWPLLRAHRAPDVSEWHAGPFYDYSRPKAKQRYTGRPWPLWFTWREPDRHGLFTPLYACESSDSPEVRDGWDAFPLLLSWRRRQGGAQSLTAGLGLYHQNLDGDARSGWLLPLCAYDTRDRSFLTPLAGWDRPDERDPDGFWYPFTPLAGVRTGAHRGGWLFPLFSHRACATNDTYDTRLLLLGHAERSRRQWSDHAWERRALGLFPLFSRSSYTSTSLDRKSGVTTESANSSRRLLLLGWSDSYRSVRRPAAGADTGTVTASADSGLFPLWRRESRETARAGGAPLSRSEESALLLALYDTKRNAVEASGQTPALDYTRRRILWRVWHYEARNGDVRVDLFPFITYDHGPDNYRKTSFLWRLYRHETSRDGKTALDLLFLPLVRQ